MLPRRDVLKLFAGIPLVIGLPARLLADDEEGCELAPPPVGEAATAASIAAALRAARAAGRPALLVSTPPGGQDDTHRRRMRIARHLASILEGEGARRRLALGQLVIVIGPAGDLARAAKADAGAADAPVFLVDDRGVARRLDATLEGTAEQAAALGDRLEQAVLGGEDAAPLRARSERELARLDASDRGEVVAALVGLGAGAFDVREKATAALSERRDGLLATLALHALTADDPEVRTRCAGLAAPDGRPRVLGARWAEFFAGCGRSDPYAEERIGIRCGRAMPSREARIYLHVVSSDS